MLDPKFIIQNPDTVREAARKKHVNFDVDHFIELDEKRRALQSEFDALRAEKNAANEKIQKLKGDEKKAAIENMRAQGDEEKKLAENLARIEAEWRGVLLRAPGLISPETPEGKDDTENEEIKTVGKIPKFDFPIKDHIELGLELDLIDLETAAKNSGARF